MLSYSNARWVLSALAVVVLLLWLPSLSVPWWGDDYVFLLQAKESRLAGDSWLVPFIEPSTTGFWRPLSMDTGWRFVEDVLGANIYYAHLYSWSLCILSMVTIGMLVHRLATLLQWAKAIHIALFTVLLHAIHIVSYLPLHWVAAMNSPTLVIFVCLSLWLWLWLPEWSGTQRLVGIAAIVVCQLLALFSKEPAILIPGLVLALMLITRTPLRWRKGEWITFIATIILGVIWLQVYKAFTPGRHSAYGLEIGTNLLVNTSSFVAWLLNIPREAIRMILTVDIVKGVLWMLACAVPMALLYLFAFNRLRQELSWGQWTAAAAFIGMTYGPYFVLAGQAYEYYAVLALILPLMFISRWITMTTRWHIGLLLYVFSASMALMGTRLAEYPAVFARAAWAEEQLQWLEQQTINEHPIVFDIENTHRFSAVGIHGVSWRLHLPLHQVRLGSSCPKGVNRLITDKYEDRLSWRMCPK